MPKITAIKHTRDQLNSTALRLARLAESLRNTVTDMEAEGVEEIEVFNAIEARKGLDRIGSFCESASKALMDCRVPDPRTLQ